VKQNKEVETLAYNLAKAAKVIGVSKPTLSRMLKEGLINHRRVGSRVIIPKIAIEQFLQGE
jgi:excisionase family DNA binding protein